MYFTKTNTSWCYKKQQQLALQQLVYHHIQLYTILKVQSNVWLFKSLLGGSAYPLKNRSENQLGLKRWHEKNRNFPKHQPDVRNLRVFGPNNRPPGHPDHPPFARGLWTTPPVAGHGRVQSAPAPHLKREQVADRSASLVRYSQIIINHYSCLWTMIIR